MLRNASAKSEIQFVMRNMMPSQYFNSAKENRDKLVAGGVLS